MSARITDERLKELRKFSYMDVTADIDSALDELIERRAAISGFCKESLMAVVDGLDRYEKTVNVGQVEIRGTDTHLESTTAYAARFIRTMLALAPGLEQDISDAADELSAAPGAETAAAARDGVAWEYTNNGSGEVVIDTAPPAEDDLAFSTVRPLVYGDAAPTAQPEASAVSAGWKLLKDSTHQERSWPEDASDENGNYSCVCSQCGRMFVGHKRRHTCKVCAAAPAAPAVVEDDENLVKLDKRDLFDFVRAAIHDALCNDNGPASAFLSDAHDRTVRCLTKLYAAPATPAVAVPPHLPIGDLLRMYDEENGDWCRIARAVEAAVHKQFIGGEG